MAATMPLSSDRPAIAINNRHQCALKSLYIQVKYEPVVGPQYTEIIGAGDLKSFNIDVGTKLELEVFQSVAVPRFNPNTGLPELENKLPQVENPAPTI